jgi:outer membrane protein assembly factor BamB
VAALLLKPRELLLLCRRRPVGLSVSAGAIALGFMAAIWLLSSQKAPRAASRTPVHYDWAKVAEDLIAQERAGKVPTSLEAATDTGAPLVLGYDYSRSSYQGGPSPVHLKPLWSFRPENTMFLSSPLVAGKRVFAAGCQVDLGAYTGLLACLDADTGKPLWQVTQVGDEPLRPFFSSPALTRDGKYLVIGQGLHQDRDCALLCLDTVTGQVRWAVKTPLHIESSPAIFGNMVVVGAGAIEGPDQKPQGHPGYVLAVRIDDGQELWRQPVNDPESSPAIDDDGTVFIGSGFNGSAVVAIRGASEDQLRRPKLDRIAWRTPLAHPVLGPITLTGDLVLAGAGNGDMVHSNRQAAGLLAALDRKTGAVRWQVAFDDAVLGAVACFGDTVICPSRAGELAAVRVADGRVLWRTHVSGMAPLLAGCAFTGQCIYAVSSDGYLAILDPRDGTILHKIYLNDQAKPGSGLTLSSPLLAQGRIVVGSETGGLHCLVGSEHGK